jgi:hypothetical protein
MLAAALEAEVDTYLAGPASERDQRGHRPVGAQRARRPAHYHDGDAPYLKYKAHDQQA